MELQIIVPQSNDNMHVFCLFTSTVMIKYYRMDTFVQSAKKMKYGA
jgi:hypothetical protein